MPERFEQLYRLPSNLYVEGSPVIIAAGSLLKDRESGRVLVQLKFHSVATKTIKAVKIGINALDVSSQPVQGVDDYQYLDLNIHAGQEFGSNKAIFMPSVVTRSFSVSGVTVVFADNSTYEWDRTTSMTPLPQAASLQSALSNPELVKQYQLETNSSAQYTPIEHGNLWYCICGEWNAVGSCKKCGLSQTIAFSAYNPATLEKHMTVRLAEEKRQKEEKQRAALIAKQEKDAEDARLQEIAAEKRKVNLKKAKITAAIVLPIVAVVLAMALWVYPDIIKPSMAYNIAQQLFEDGKYSEAATAFDALGNYRDSEKRVEEIMLLMMDDIYEYGIQLMEDGDFTTAIEKFVSLGNYRDSQEKITECNNSILKYEYDAALILMGEGNYEEAIAIFESLGSYEDSSQQIVNCTDALLQIDYNQALLLLEAEDYAGAYEAFYAIYDYKDAAQYLNSFLIVPQKSTEGHYCTEYTYDKNGALTVKIVDGYRDYTAEYFYDEAGLLIHEIKTFSDGEVDDIIYSYNSIGQLVKSIDTELTTIGTTDIVVDTFSYDERGNLIKNVRTYEDNTWITEYIYDGENYLIRKNADGGYTEYSYDENGNVIAEKFSGIANNNHTIRYIYSEQGVLLEQKYTSPNYGHNTVYIYDTNGYLVEIVHTEDDGDVRRTEYSDYQVFYKPNKAN